MSENIRETLNQNSENIPPEKRSDQIFEQYKLYLELTDRISSRRQTANTFFLSINTAIVTLNSYLAIGMKGVIGFALVAVSGMFLSYIWYRLIRSYKDLNTAKFKVIQEIESHLPLSPYNAEWEAVGRGKNSDLYLPFTKIEQFVPWVFFAIHLFVLGMCIFSKIL